MMIDFRNGLVAGRVVLSKAVASRMIQSCSGRAGFVLVLQKNGERQDLDTIRSADNGRFDRIFPCL